MFDLVERQPLDLVAGVLIPNASAVRHINWDDNEIEAHFD